VKFWTAKKNEMPELFELAQILLAVTTTNHTGIIFKYYILTVKFTAKNILNLFFFFFFSGTFSLTRRFDIFYNR